MNPKIVFVADFPGAADAAAELLPAGFDTVSPPAGPERDDALRGAEYLVGFVDGLVDESLFRRAPKLRLIQLLSAGLRPRRSLRRAPRRCSGRQQRRLQFGRRFRTRTHAHARRVAPAGSPARECGAWALARKRTPAARRTARQDPGRRRAGEYRAADGAPGRRFRHEHRLLRRRAACAERGRSARRSLPPVGPSCSAKPTS